MTKAEEVARKINDVMLREIMRAGISHNSDSSGSTLTFADGSRLAVRVRLMEKDGSSEVVIY